MCKAEVTYSDDKSFNSFEDETKVERGIQTDVQEDLSIPLRMKLV